MHIRTYILCAGAIATISGFLIAQSYPQWWLDSGIAPSQPPAAPGETGYDAAVYDAWMADNYAVANLGQAKNLATQAFNTMDDANAGSAGSVIEDMATAFSTAPEDNFVPLTIGQLKALSAPFYDVMHDAEFVVTLADDTIVPNGSYPWTTDVTPDNLAIANLGQLKHVFSFDLVRWPPNSNQAPSLSLLSSTNYRYYITGANIVLSAKSIDPDGDAVTVEFLANNQSLGSVSASSIFELSWTSIGSGDITLSAIATDINGNQSETVSQLINLSADSDNDDMPDAYEQTIIDASQNDSAPNNDLSTIEEVNPGDDFDQDGTSNANEATGGTSGTNPQSGEATGDDDNDGLSNEEELLYGTSVNNPDTDGDGVEDGQDGWALCAQFAPSRLSGSTYAVVVLGEFPSKNISNSMEINNNSHALYYVSDASGRDNYYYDGSALSILPDTYQTTYGNTAYYSYSKLNETNYFLQIGNSAVNLATLYNDGNIVQTLADPTSGLGLVGSWSEWSSITYRAVLTTGEVIGYGEFYNETVTDYRARSGIIWDSSIQASCLDTVPLRYEETYSFEYTDPETNYGDNDFKMITYTMSQPLTQNVNGGSITSISDFNSQNVLIALRKEYIDYWTFAGNAWVPVDPEDPNSYFIEKDFSGGGGDISTQIGIWVNGNFTEIYGLNNTSGAQINNKNMICTDGTLWRDTNAGIRNDQSVSSSPAYEKIDWNASWGATPPISLNAEMEGFDMTRIWKNCRWFDIDDLTVGDQWSDIKIRDMNDHGTCIAEATNSSGNQCVVLLLKMDFGVYPVAENADAEVKISADDAEQELAAVVLVPDLSSDAEPGAMTEVDDGTVIEWELIDGSGTLSTQQATTTDGVAITRLATSTNPGDTYKVKARVITLKMNNGSLELGENGLVAESDVLEVVPGKAASFEITKSKTEYRSDATDEVEIEISVKDQHDNPLADGMAVTWILDKSTGGFVSDDEGKELVDLELTNGSAQATLRAPTMPTDQNLITIVDGLTEEISMTVDRVEGSISSSLASLDVYVGDTATITVSANAAEGTPVFWFSSNGSISTNTGNLSGGQATATLSSTGGRIGDAVVTATVGDRMFIWEGAFTSSAPVQVSFEHPFLIGAIQDGDSPPQNNEDEDFEGPWFILTKGVINAPDYGGFLATVNVTGAGSLVQITGLDGSSQITLDQHGYAEFEVASAGSADQFGRVTIQVQINPEGAAYVEIVETTPWTHVGDFFGGFIGLDTSTGTGVVTSIIGGYILIGDVGVVVKNGVRNAGWSDQEPNNLELVLGGAGLLGTFSGPGDGIVSAIRIIIQRLGNSPLADVLWRIAKNIITNGKLPSAAEEAFITVMKNDAVFSQAVKDVLTDDKLFAQAARGLDKLGHPFANAVKNAATSPSLGIKTSQKIVDTVGGLSDEVLDGLKSSGKLDDALAGMTKLLDAGVVDPQLLGKTLNNTDVFSGAYKQADLLSDAKVILEASPNITGFDRLLRTIAKADNPGFLFELRGAQKLTSAGETVLEVATEGLSATDLRTATHLVQAKLTATTLENFVSKKGLGSIAAGSQKAKSLGLDYKIIISEGKVNAKLLKWLSDRGITIEVLSFP